MSIQSSIVHSGAGSFAGHSSGTTSSTIRQVLFTSNQNIKGWMRMYLYIATGGTPSGSAIQLMRFETTANANCGNIRLNTTGTLQLQQISGTNIGSPTAALAVNQWHMIELGIDATGSGTLEARLNGVTFASGANSAQGSWARISCGATVGVSTHDMYYADIAVNDDSGSAQNTWCGEEKFVYLRPNGTGDVNTFAATSGGTAGQANNYTRVSEVTPDGNTSINSTVTLNNEDLYNVTDSGIGATDTVNVVHIGWRFGNFASGTGSTITLECEKASGGTKATATGIAPTSTTYRTNQNATPWTYPLTLYLDPDGAPWTQATLDTMQIGMKNTSAVASPRVDVSAMWVLVGYTPAVVATNVGLFSVL